VREMRSILVSTVLLCAACTDVGSFSTEVGECYRGIVVDASFVRAGFEPGAKLSLTLNTDALADGRGTAGVLWTSDGIFDDANISQMEQLAHDSLSLFQFPQGRIRNYLLYVTASDGAPATVVISLMENEEVEVRVMRPKVDLCEDGDEECDDTDFPPALFGVFRLSREAGCAVP
jgi:hypothetical protein